MSDESSLFSGTITSSDSSMDKTMEPDYIVKSLTNIASLRTRHNLTKNATIDVVKAINASNPVFTVPTSKRKIIAAASHGLEYFYYVVCPSCDRISRNDTDQFEKCTHCGIQFKENLDIFIQIPLEQQLEIIVDKYYNEIMEYKDSHSDIQNCTSYKNLVHKNSKHIVLSIMCCTDGANFLAASKQSVWPILCILNFLPPYLRFRQSNIVMTTLFIGKAKPKNMKHLFVMLIAEMNHLYKRGMQFERNGEIVQFLPVISHFIGDLPCRATVQNLKQFNGSHACCYCQQLGDKVPGGGNVMHYLKTKHDQPARTHEQTIKLSLKAERLAAKDPELGVMGISCLAGLPDFDVINGCPIDPLHCFYVGVCKLLIQLIVFSTEYGLTPQARVKLDKILKSVKLSSEISYTPRSLDQLSTYKAIDYRNLFFYYLPIAIQKINLKNEYVQLIGMFSNATFILTKENQSENEIEDACAQLIKFADNFEKAFNKKHVSMNVHLLRHVKQSIENCGPIWCNSMFPFERQNGVLKRMINGTYQMNKELVRKYLSSLIQADKYVFKISTTIVGELGFFKVPSKNEIEDLKKINYIAPNKIKCFKVINNGQRIASETYTKSNRIDSFVKVSNGLVGSIKLFYHIENEFYLRLDKYKYGPDTNHLHEIVPLNKTEMFKVSEIVEKPLLFRISDKILVCSVPNKFENMS